jgi:hypothetical protein
MNTLFIRDDHGFELFQINRFYKITIYSEFFRHVDIFSKFRRSEDYDGDFDTLTDMFQATHCKKCGLCHIYHLKNLVDLCLRKKNKHRNIAVRSLVSLLKRAVKKNKHERKQR